MKSSKLLLIVLFFGNIALADTATVFDPVSLIRIKPDGKILCSVKEVKEIEVLRFNDDWYSTNACGSMGVINKSQIKFTTGDNTPESFKYDAAGLFYDGSAPVKVGKFWGLIDVNEKWLVSPEYENIGRYNEGVMAVKQNEKFAFIDSKGKKITNFSYDAARYFSSNFAGVKLGNKWGYINKKGKLLIPARYDAVREFKEGFAPVRIKKKWGFINKQGKWLVKPIYDAAYNFSDGIAVVVVKNKRGFITKKGQFKIKPSYRRVLRFSEGIAPVSTKKGQWYFVDKQNKQLFNKSYSSVRTFSEGLTAVMNDENKWGYITKSGELKIQYQFDKAYDFKNGIALVRKEDNRGFINVNGKIIISLIYKDAYQFSEGLAPVKKGNKWGYIKKVKPIEVVKTSIATNSITTTQVKNTTSITKKSSIENLVISTFKLIEKGMLEISSDISDEEASNYVNEISMLYIDEKSFFALGGKPDLFLKYRKKFKHYFLKHGIKYLGLNLQKEGISFEKNIKFKYNTIKQKEYRKETGFHKKSMEELRKKGYKKPPEKRIYQMIISDGEKEVTIELNVDKVEERNGKWFFMEPIKVHIAN